MSDESRPAGQRFDDDREEWPVPDPDELRLLEERLEELRAEGILSGSRRAAFDPATHRPHPRRPGAVSQKARLTDDSAVAMPPIMLQ